MKISRRQSREKTLQVLYSLQFNKPKSIIKYIQRYSDEINQSLVNDDYALKIIQGVLENVEEIDRLIKKFANDETEETTFADISCVDLNIMRISVYEFVISKEVPFSISVDEAIELAKNYSAYKSKSLINGILASINEHINGEK